MIRFVSFARRVSTPFKQPSRRMGGAAQSSRPKNPNCPYDNFEPNDASSLDKYMATGLIVSAWLWILFGFKEKGAQMFGFYKPWLDHSHDEH